MAAMRCAGASRALLRRSPGLLRRAADVSERGLLRQPMAPLSLSSNRCISSYFDIQDHTKKNLAVALMKDRSAYKEIAILDEVLDLINSAKKNESYRSPYDVVVSDSGRQLEAARTSLEKKKLELVSLLLRPDADVKNEYKNKIEEFVAAARLHRQSLLLENIREQNAKIIAGMVLMGIPITMLVLAKLQ